MTPSSAHRLGLALTAATAVLLVLAASALGILGDGGRPDRVYVVVLAVLLLGSVVARLRAAGMVVALLGTAAAQVVVTAVALLGDLAPPDASVVDVVAVTAMYAGLWATAAWLFHRASGARSAVSVGRPRTPAPRG